MRHNTRKFLRKIAIAVLPTLFLTAAITPSRAASNLATELLELDRGTMALIATFTILFFAIVFEVWRLTRLQDMPRPRHSHDTLNRISHE